jgi:uncharacterized membrane protein
LAKNKKKVSKPTEDEKLLAAISYFWILALLILVSKKEDPYVSFHAKQGVVLFFASILCGFIPVIGAGVEIIILLLMFFGFKKAISGERYPIPLISDMARLIR